MRRTDGDDEDDNGSGTMVASQSAAVGKDKSLIKAEG